MEIENFTNDGVDADETDSSETERNGLYCCGSRMVLAPSEIVFICLECGYWYYSST
jgi:hypothetical protein